METAITRDIVNKDFVENLAGELYEQYSKAVGGKSVNGDDLPNFDTLCADETKFHVINGWNAVAVYAVNKLMPVAKDSELPNDAKTILGKTAEPGIGDPADIAPVQE